MPVEQVTVNIVSSVDSFLGLVLSVLTDVKAGKPVATVVSDAVPQFVTALSEVSSLSSDVADKKDLETTVALKVAEIVNVLAP